MNFKINLPFTNLKFIDSPSKGEKFFKDLLFPISLNTPQKFSVEVKFSKKINLTSELQLENDCITSNGDFVVLDTKKNKCRLNFHSFTEKKIYLELENNFDLYYFFTFILEPLFIIWSAHHQILYLHASGVAKNNRVTLFTAWRNTGKTNAVLNLCQREFDFCGDDFCVIKNGVFYLYPKSLNLFSYNLRSFPNVFKQINFTTAQRLKLTSAFKKQLFNLSQLFSGSLSKILYRISELAEVSTNIKLKPAQLGIKVCEEGKIETIVILQKSNLDLEKDSQISLNDAKDKILNTIKYELKDFYKIYSKYNYLFPNSKNLLIENFDKNYSSLISTNLVNFKIRYLKKDS